MGVIGLFLAVVLNASFLRIAGEDIGGRFGPEEPMFVVARRAKVSLEYGIYDFLAGAAAVTL